MYIEEQLDSTLMNQSRHNLRSLSSALKSTEFSGEFGVHGPVPPNTYRSKERLAAVFGFKSEDTFLMWVDSEGFKPYYRNLQKGLTKSNNGTKRSRQGPQLQIVQSAIEEGERFGINKFSRRSGPDLDNFAEIDHYALCLFYMTEFNCTDRRGAFFGKKMTVSDVQTRIWQAILHANYESAPSRQRRNNPSDPVEHDSDDSTSTLRKTAEKPLEKPSTQRENENAGKQHQVEVDAWETLKKTQNKDDPFDINTAYGQYMSIHAAVKGYNDPVNIQTMFVQHASAANGGHNLEDFNAQSKQWFNELEQAYRNSDLEYRKATGDDSDGLNHLEKMLDNPVFQRLDYVEDCATLGITDLAAPRLEGMTPTTVLKSWQLCGIKALLDFEKNPILSACVVADSTGLGKTIQCIAYWMAVSTISLSLFTVNTNAYFHRDYSFERRWP